jgi:hypothetical protein
VAVLYAVRVGWLRQLQAGFGGQRVGSRPSCSVLGCRCFVSAVDAALRRFIPVGKARAGSALTGQVVGRLLVGDRWTRSLAVVSL